MKFQRNLDSEIVEFCFLTSDYRKLALLCADRSIELHAQYGKHYKTRIPRFGRDMIYHKYTSELLIAGATNEVYRLNLEQGRFMASLESNVCEEMNSVEVINELPWVFIAAGPDGLIECWDLRKRSRAALVDTFMGEINVLASEKLMMASGHTNGQVKLFDIRFPKPLQTITHKNRLEIKSLGFHGDFILTADPKALKISNKNNAELMTTVETVNNINQVECVSDSGMVFTANETQRVGSYYIPLLGPAPRWCSFIDALNDEIEEEKVTINENKQFVTVEELEKISASELIGTEELVGYMHGYLMDSKLYYKLKALAEPFDYKEYRKERIAKKLEEKTKERITVQKKTPKVNKMFAAQVLSEDPKGKNAKNKELLNDSRFNLMFEDKNFEINQESEEFKRIYRKRDVLPDLENRLMDDQSSEEQEDEEIVPNIPKKRKKEKNIIQESEESDENLPFVEKIDKVVKIPKVKKVKKSKILNEKPDLEGRRTVVPMQKMLNAKSKDYRKFH
jgi:ribosome biogenesis protein ENP2